MSIRSLASACGVGLFALQTFLKETTIFEEVTNKQGNIDCNSFNINEKEVTNKSSIYLI